MSGEDKNLHTHPMTMEHSKKREQRRLEREWKMKIEGLKSKIEKDGYRDVAAADTRRELHTANIGSQLGAGHSHPHDPCELDSPPAA